MSLLKVVFEDKEFRSQKEFLKYYGVPENTYWQRRKRGLSMRQCLGLDPYRPSYARWREMGLCDVDGVEIEKAHYRLYEIVNRINGKIYIGITTQSLSLRWRGHVYDSLTKTTPLYHAMRKYGVENFDMRLIREDARSGAELQKQEVNEIKTRNATDHTTGYNIASGGSTGNSKSFTIAGQTFPSRSEAAAHFGVNIGAFYKRVRDGFTPEQAAGLEPMPNIRGYRLSINGREMNLMDAVVALGKNYRCVNTRLRRGWTYRQAFDFDPPPPRLGRNKRINNNNDTSSVVMA